MRGSHQCRIGNKTNIVSSRARVEKPAHERHSICNSFASFHRLDPSLSNSSVLPFRQHSNLSATYNIFTTSTSQVWKIYRRCSLPKSIHTHWRETVQCSISGPINWAQKSIYFDRVVSANDRRYVSTSNLFIRATNLISIIRYASVFFLWKIYQFRRSSDDAIFVTRDSE